WAGVAGVLAQWALGRPAIYGLPRAVPWLKLGETVYRDPEPPRPLPVSAAALLEGSWAAAREEARFRKAAARDMLATLIAHRSARPIRITPGGTPGFLRLPVRVRGGFPALPDARAALR